MRFIRRATQRAASFAAAIASVFLLATCDLDKIVNVDTSRAATLDSTDLTLTITGGPDLIVLGTATVSVAATPASGVDLTSVTKEYESSDPTTISVVKTTGAMTALKVGQAKITARLMAPELGAGVTYSRIVVVRYKGIKVVTPVVLDSLTGLGQTRSVSIQGTNALDQVVAGTLAADSVRVRVGGVFDTSLLRVQGTTVTAKKNGTSYVVAILGTLKDSVAVKVRQVAKSITYPTADYTARHVNYNLSVPLTVKDVQDSTIPTPTLTWRTKDTTRATIGSATGILRVKSLLSDTVWARMDTVERGQRIVVSQIVGSLQKFLGDAQTDTVALPAAINPTITAVDSGNTVVQGASVTFKRGIGLNATVTDTVKVTDANGRAAMGAWKLGDVAGSSNNTVIATAASGATTTFTASAVNGPVRKLAFLVQPASSQSGVAFNPAVKVQALDSLNNPVASFTGTVSVTIGNNPGGSGLSGTTVTNAVAGVATFTNLAISSGFGAGYTLQANSAGLTSAISNGFDVYGAPTKLGFLNATPTPTASAIIAPPIRVAVQDAQGVTVANAVNVVSLGFTGGPGGATISGTGIPGGVAAVAGVATFNDVRLSTAGSGYVLQATATSLTTASSSAFAVAAVGSASKLAFSVQPSNVVSGVAIAPSIKVQVLDANGALITGSSQQITLSIESTSPSGGTLGGTPAQNAVGGVATFPDISINKAGTGFKLLATAIGTTLTTATSTPFNVTTGVATKLGFAQMPTHTVAGQNIAPGVAVEVQDAGGNRVTSGSPYTVGLTLGGCTATLNNGGGIATVNGVATFSTLNIATQVTGCTLTAAATGLTSSSPSTAFNIVAATGPSRLSFTTEPSGTAGAGVPLTASPVVTIQDATGANTTSSTSVSIILSVLSGPQPNFTTGGGSQSTTTNTTFSNVRFNKAGTYKLLASAVGFRPDTSADIVISPAAANNVTFVVQPSNTVAGVPFANTLTVCVCDTYGNIVPGSTNSVEISYYQIGGSASALLLNTGSQQATKAAVDGIATFTGLAPRTATTAGYLVPRSTGINESQSATFSVSPAPLSKLGFVVQPTTDTVATTMTPSVQVAGQDSVGNTVVEFTSPVTVALTGGEATATLGGTKTQNAASGIAVFNNLSIDRSALAYQLSASASGTATATSSAFNIDPLYLSTTSLCCNKFVVLGSNVYVVHGNALKSLPVAGGAVTSITGSTNAVSVTTDGTNIFWAERGTNNNGDAFVKKLTVGTGAISTLTTGLISLMPDDNGRMYSDGTNVYFIARNAGNTAAAIKSVSVNAVSAAPTDLFSGNFTSPNFLLSGGLIYFYDPSTTTIRRMTNTGASQTALSTSPNVGARFALIGTDLYFNDGVNIKKIANAPSAGGPVAPTAVLTASGTVYELTANAGNLYVNFDASIRRYNPANFSTFSILSPAGSQSYPSFDFDASGLYFMHNTSRISRVPK